MGESLLEYVLPPNLKNRNNLFEKVVMIILYSDGTGGGDSLGLAVGRVGDGVGDSLDK